MAKMYLVSVISVLCSFSHFGSAHKDEFYPQQNITTKYGDGVSLERTTTFRNDYGIIFERATTYKSDYDASPKITKKYTNGSGVSSDLTTHNMYDYSLSSAPMLETSIWIEDTFTMRSLFRAWTNASTVQGKNNDEREDYFFKIYSKCPSGLGYNPVVLPLEHLKTVYFELAIVVQITFGNSFILYIFQQKGNRTPVTILLSALAISDATAAILMTIPIFIAYQIYDNQIDYNKPMPMLYMCDFPQCLIYSLLYEIKYAFHFVSVLLTAFICLQKTAALLWPIWSKRHLTNHVSTICSVSTFIFCTCIFIPILYHSSLIKKVNESCCDSQSISLRHVYLYFYTLVNGCSILACLVVVFCTVYIICKLTILRRNLPWTDSQEVQKKNRISAITVLLICVIFILSESMFFVAVLLFTLTRFKIIKSWLLYDTLKPYTCLSLIIGFSLNFIVYIVMGRQIRNKLRIALTNIVKCCKCW